MNGPHVKLTLVCPPQTGEQIVEFLIDSDSIVSGFTTVSANGHGEDFSTASVAERVRGHVSRTWITLVLEHDLVGKLLSQLRAKYPSPHIVYWTEPVIEFGDFS